jgi:hypothetical protein
MPTAYYFIAVIMLANAWLIAGGSKIWKTMPASLVLAYALMVAFAGDITTIDQLASAAVYGLVPALFFLVPALLISTLFGMLIFSLTRPGKRKE